MTVENPYGLFRLKYDQNHALICKKWKTYILRGFVQNRDIFSKFFEINSHANYVDSKYMFVENSAKVGRIVMGNGSCNKKEDKELQNPFWTPILAQLFEPVFL